MKTILLILTWALVISCRSLKESMNNNYVLYYKTKAFIVTEELNPHKLIVINGQMTQKFRLYDYDNVFDKNDTIIAYENQWIYNQLKFINK